MDFFINKGATLPILKMELIHDGRHDFNDFHELIQNTDIYFSMTNVENGYKKICRNSAGCGVKSNVTDEIEEYYITYQFSERETNKAGTYRAQFEIEFLDGSGTLIVPIREELYVHVIEGSIKL